MRIEALRVGTFSPGQHFECHRKTGETSLARLPQDKDRIERATREARSIIAIERQAREAKTARLRELRLSSEAPASTGAAKRKPGTRKAARKTIDVT
ncbi:MAG: hypothetical protein E5Y31_16715 [Mesorhizobium sp.]|nr:MAG: hypothetical protein E5Y31_16715 [Mesorhizobium sp.]